MQVNVSQLLKTPVGSSRNYKVNEVVDVADSSIMVQGELGLMHTNRGILAEGTLHTDFEVTCSRCLIPYSCPLTLNIEEEYFPTVDITTGVALSVPDEPGCFTIDEQHVIDLTDAIRQYVEMAVPMKPLCREDCAGLCSQCGHNLNQGSCDCSHEETDPRLSALRDYVSGSSLQSS
ncbi:DUF177 domain-containing protein [Chloroflexota bacterium]